MLAALQDGIGLVPLRGKDGSVQDFSIVDVESLDDVLALRWYRTYYGYAGSRFKGEGLLLHRVVLDLESGDGEQADHINGDCLDNRRANLRVVTAAQNRQNQRSTRGTSRFRGVHLHGPTGRWIAQAGGKHLGYFAAEEEAARASADYRAEHMPFSKEASR